MLSARDIQRRIKSISNTKQITKAMEMVAASKMKRSQEAALETRYYAKTAMDVLFNISKSEVKQSHYLLNKREIKKALIIIVTSDKGLCGGLNGNTYREITKVTSKLAEDKVSMDFMMVGKKGRDFIAKTNSNIVAEFVDFPDKFTLRDIAPITQVSLKDFKSKKYDQVILIYSDFVSTLVQKPVTKYLLPLSKENLIKLSELGSNKTLEDDNKSDQIKKTIEYNFEPSPKRILDVLLPRLVEMQIYQAILENKASEHSARMVAMKNASENAGEIISDLNLTYNRVRQAGITQEIAEISSGAEAIKN